MAMSHFKGMYGRTSPVLDTYVTTGTRDRLRVASPLATEFPEYSACGKAAYMGKGNKECSYQITSEEHVRCDHPQKSLVCFMIEANEERQ